LFISQNDTDKVHAEGILFGGIDMARRRRNAFN
jgi:hypothetical protein